MLGHAVAQVISGWLFGAVLEQFMWDLGWKDWHWGMFLSALLFFLCGSG